MTRDDDFAERQRQLRLEADERRQMAYAASRAASRQRMIARDAALRARARAEAAALKAEAAAIKAEAAAIKAEAEYRSVAERPRAGSEGE